MDSLPPGDTALTALAQSLGANALPLFFATLLLLLVAVGTAGWWVQLRRRRRSAMPRQAHPWAMLALRFGLGFAVIVTAAAIFAGIADEVHAGEDLARLDALFSDAVRQATSPRTMQAFAWITHLGDTATLTALGVLVAVALFVAGHRLLALGWVIAVVGNSLLNTALKGIFERVRPPHNAEFALASGWSFPSGHSSGSVVAYGMLAYVLLRTLPAPWHLPALLAATTAAFATGWSRVFLQAHYASDVVAGFASGLAWLAICIGSIEFSRVVRNRRR